MIRRTDAVGMNDDNTLPWTFRGRTYPPSCCALFLLRLHLDVVLFSQSRVVHVHGRQRWQYDIAKFAHTRHVQHRRRRRMNPTRSRSQMPSAGLSTPSRHLPGDPASPSSAYQVPTLSASGNGWSAPPEQQQQQQPLTIRQTHTDMANTAMKLSLTDAIPNHKS